MDNYILRELKLHHSESELHVTCRLYRVKEGLKLVANPPHSSPRINLKDGKMKSNGTIVSPRDGRSDGGSYMNQKSLSRGDLEYDEEPEDQNLLIECLDLEENKYKVQAVSFKKELCIVIGSPETITESIKYKKGEALSSDTIVLEHNMWSNDFKEDFQK